MSATMTAPWPTAMFDPNPWWPWPPQGVIPLPVPVLLGGTGTTTAAGAREALGIQAAITSALQPVIQTMLPDAPANANIYGRSNGAWVIVSAGTPITLPLSLAQGGTGVAAANAAAVLTALGALPAAGGTVTGALDLGATASLHLNAAASATLEGTLNVDGPLFVTDGTTLQPVTIGAADTGDTGFRVLQVPN